MATRIHEYVSITPWELTSSYKSADEDRSHGLILVGAGDPTAGNGYSFIPRKKEKKESIAAENKTKDGHIKEDRNIRRVSIKEMERYMYRLQNEVFPDRNDM